MQRRAMTAALILGALSWPMSASATTISLSSCVAGSCAEGYSSGSIDITLTLVPGNLLDLQIDVQNNLATGSLTQFGFDFVPTGSVQAYTSSIVSKTTTAGFVKLDNLHAIDGIESISFDLGLGGLKPNPPDNFAPTEAIRVVLNTTPDLTSLLLTQPIIGWAKIQGAGADASAGYRLTSGPAAGASDIPVPEPASLLLVGSGLVLAGRLRSRARR